MNSFGYTEDYYDGPLGKGAGHMLPSVKNSPFYPDGYYLHRSFWVLRNALGEKHPNPEPGAKVVKDDVLFSRGWSWPTENDARAVLEVSKFLVEGRVIEKPLSRAQVKNSFSLTAPMVKQAYERLGAQPPAAEFMRTDVADQRGQPVWEMAKWSDRA